MNSTFRSSRAAPLLSLRPSLVLLLAVLAPLLALLPSSCLASQNIGDTNYPQYSIGHNSGHGSQPEYYGGAVPEGCLVPPNTYAVGAPTPGMLNPYVFDCAPGHELSGLLESPWYCGAGGVWSYSEREVPSPPPQCVLLDFTGCHQVTSTSWLTSYPQYEVVDGAPEVNYGRFVSPLFTQAGCATNELVIAGGGACGNGDNLYYSAPMANLSGWEFGCMGHPFPYQPLYASALCCPIASDTFVVQPPWSPIQPTLPNPDLPTLPAQSFLQSCSLASTAPSLVYNAPSVVNNGATTYSVNCPSGKFPVAGGGACPQFYSLQYSYAYTAGGTWSWEVACYPPVASQLGPAPPALIRAVWSTALTHTAASCLPAVLLPILLPLQCASTRSLFSDNPCLLPVVCLAALSAVCAVMQLSRGVRRSIRGRQRQSADLPSAVQPAAIRHRLPVRCCVLHRQHSARPGQQRAVRRADARYAADGRCVVYAGRHCHRRHLRQRGQCVQRRHRQRDVPSLAAVRWWCRVHGQQQQRAHTS